MHREIPEHVHVCLHQPEIDPSGIVIMDLAELTPLDEVADFAHRRRVDERVIHHQDQLSLGRLFDELLPQVGTVAERLLHEDVLPGPQAAHRDLEMRVDRCRDRDRIDVRILDQIVDHRGGLDMRILRPRPSEPLGIEIGDREKLAIPTRVKIPQQIRAPIPATHDADSNPPAATGNCILADMMRQLAIAVGRR